MGNKTKKFAVIVAGGVGKRMGSSIPKQFIPIGGLPILMHTLTAFYKSDHEMEIILVLPVSHFGEWTNLSVKYDFDVPHRIVAGGSTRYHSVKNGLLSIEEDGLVAIHDGVRPFVSTEIIENSFIEANKSGNGVVSIPLKDTLRHLGKKGSKPLDRSEYRLVQTPQTFRIGEIKKAYEVEFSENITDDASVAEAAGQKINLIEGSYRNIKITTEEDLVFARAVLSES